MYETYFISGSNALADKRKIIDSFAFILMHIYHWMKLLVLLYERMN